MEAGYEDDGMVLPLYEVAGESASCKVRKSPSVVDTPLLVLDLGACEYASPKP